MSLRARIRFIENQVNIRKGVIVRIVTDEDKEATCIEANGQSWSRGPDESPQAFEARVLGLLEGFEGHIIISCESWTPECDSGVTWHD